MSSILVCTDGSPYAPSIYQHANWAATRLNTPVHVLHVIGRGEAPENHDLSGSIGFQASEELLEELTRLDETRARLARLRGKAILEDAVDQIGKPGTATTQRHGSLVDAVLDFEDSAALVVLGKRGEHADFSTGHLGSNLERVIRAAQIPVLVAARSFKPVKRFLIAFDGGDSCLKAIEFVSTQPLLQGAECHIITVGKADGAPARAMEDAAGTLKRAGFTVTAELLAGEADEAISRKVDQGAIDLVVMGAYGHSRIRQFILGSTTTTLIRTCQVPVLLFR